MTHRGMRFLMALAWPALLASSLVVTLAPAATRSEPVTRNDPVDDNLRDPDVAAGRPVDVPPGAADAPATDVFSAVAAPASAVDTRPQGGGTLAHQVQVLQQELQQLRGVLEEQQHRIARMESDQKSRYADMDRRMTGAAQRPRVVLAAVRPVAVVAQPAW